MSDLCIGLFGTCGGTTFRQQMFIPRYDRLGMSYYNPQNDFWKPEDAITEAEHLANDRIILFPITNETYGLGSLGEVGFSILNAIKLDDRRHFIVMIDNGVNTTLPFEWETKLVTESIRMRALVKQHIKKLNYSNIYCVSTLDEMLELSIILYKNDVRIHNYLGKINV